MDSCPKGHTDGFEGNTTGSDADGYETCVVHKSSGSRDEISSLLLDFMNVVVRWKMDLFFRGQT